MHAVLLIIRGGLAVILAAAAAGKLSDRAGTDAAVTAFGVPRRVSAPVSLALSVSELGVAVLLLFTATARAGAVATATLMVIFSFAIVRVLSRGERPACNCFGARHPRPVGARELGRNTALAAFAVVVAIGGAGESVAHAMAGVGAWDVVVAVVLVGVGFFQVQLLRQNGRLLMRIRALEESLITPAVGSPSGLPAGAHAPAFALPGIDGELRSLESLLFGGRSLLLVFLDPDCAACSSLGPVLDDVARSGELRLAVVTRGTAAQARRRIGAAARAAVLLQTRQEVAELYGAHQVPSAVVVSADGRISGPLAVGPAAIQALITEHRPDSLRMIGAAL